MPPATPNQAGILRERDLIHEILPVGLLQCNCHVVGDPVTHEAIVIDPGDEVERILEVIARHKLKVVAILNTHAHIDHVGGLKKMHDATGAPVLMNEDDLVLYGTMEAQARWIRMPMPAIAQVDEFLREGTTVKWGNYELRVIHTPGHTEGSVCLFLPKEATRILAPHEASRTDTRSRAALESPNVLFAGDTLFAGSIGRTDLWGGSPEDILRSIQTKLMTLPDDTIVYPGHGPATTIGEERETNPFLRRV